MGFLLHSAWFYVCMASTLVAHISYVLHLERDAVRWPTSTETRALGVPPEVPTLP